MLLFINLNMSGYGRKGLRGGRYVVEIINGSCVVFTCTARKSVKKSSISL